MLCSSTKTFIAAGEVGAAAAGGQGARRDGKPPAVCQHLKMEHDLQAADPQAHHHRQRLQPRTDRLRYLSRHILRRQPHLRDRKRHRGYRHVPSGRAHRPVSRGLHHVRLFSPPLGWPKTTGHIVRPGIFRCSLRPWHISVLPLPGIGTHRHLDRGRIHPGLRGYKHARIFRLARNCPRGTAASKNTGLLWWLPLCYF